jgi:SAM-dependent methyltransferase
MRPRHDYSGLVADVYDLDALEYDDESFYRDLIVAGNGPALEIGSGTGRLLIPYARAGLDVEGVEPSPDMTQIGYAKADSAGVNVVVYPQYMQELDLPRRYQTIYVPMSSFQLLDDLDDAGEALKRFHDHLRPGGRLVVSLYIPVEELKLNNEWRLTHRLRRPDGSMVLISFASRANTAKQLLRSTSKYEVFGSDGVLSRTEMHPFSLRWYSAEEFAGMLEKAGFSQSKCTGELTDETYEERHRFMIFQAVR